MPRFIFELEPVLDHRRRQERDIQRRVAEIDRHRIRLEREIEDARGAIAQEQAALRDTLSGAGAAAHANLPAARAQQEALASLRRELARRVLELDRASARAEAARAELRDASARRKAVEALRDRRFEAWRRDQLRREQADLDDIATGRVVRGVGAENAP